MARLVWSVLCRRATIDKDTNSVSLMEVTEQLNVKATSFSSEGPNRETPLLLAWEFDLVSLWMRSDPEEPERTTERVVFVGPDGRALGEPVVTEVDLESHQRMRSRLRMNGLPLSGTGYHFFVIEQPGDQGEWLEVARVPLDVRIEVEQSEISSESNSSST